MLSKCGYGGNKGKEKIKNVIVLIRLKNIRNNKEEGKNWIGGHCPRKIQ